MFNQDHVQLADQEALDPKAANKKKRKEKEKIRAQMA